MRKKNTELLEKLNFKFKKKTNVRTSMFEVRTLENEKVVLKVFFYTCSFNF